MCAFVYALNDSDERVRAEAADEIGDQVRKYGCCCCSDKVVQALTCALADCDRHVRCEAKEALECCGYEVVDCCKPDCCAPKCGPSCGPACAPACGAPEAAPMAPAPMQDAAPPAPPAPPADSKSTMAPHRTRSKLANLFGLLD